MSIFLGTIKQLVKVFSQWLLEKWQKTMFKNFKAYSEINLPDFS